MSPPACVRRFASVRTGGAWDGTDSGVGEGCGGAASLEIGKENLGRTGGDGGGAVSKKCVDFEEHKNLVPWGNQISPYH